MVDLTGVKAELPVCELRSVVQRGRGEKAFGEFVVRVPVDDAWLVAVGELAALGSAHDGVRVTVQLSKGLRALGESPR